MPGDIIFHNADSTYDNSLEWKFDIIDLSGNDYNIFAESRVIQNNNSELAIWAAINMDEDKGWISINVILVLLVGISIVVIVLKKRK